MVKSLAHKSVRTTKKKQWILSFVQSSGRALTLEEICSGLGKRKRHMFFSTVYRNMERFVAQGLVRKVGEPSDRKVRYEFKHSQHHHHVICTGCNKVLHFDACPLGRAFQKRLQEETRFLVHDHILSVYGLCHRCRAARLACHL